MRVKDYKGELISKERARRITDEDGNPKYYEEGVSCIKMADGKWYRITTGKILYDNSTEGWVFSKDFKGVHGIIGGTIDDYKLGYYSNIESSIEVNIKTQARIKKTAFDVTTKVISTIEEGVKLSGKWEKTICINLQVAEKLGFVESIHDGKIYKKSDCTPGEIEQLTIPNIPNSEKTNTYSLDDDRNTRIALEDAYDSNNLKVDRQLSLIARRWIPYSFGLELETQNGFCPNRVRTPLGFRACRDGSLEGGLEFVSVPFEGGKGLQAVKQMCEELTKRTMLSHRCSVHIHFGDVRRDRLYFLSLWKLLFLIQQEFMTYFPYSRTHSIRDDGKIYAALLPDLGIVTEGLMKITNDEEFKVAVTKEWCKIYTYLNEGHAPGETYEEEFVRATRETIVKGKLQKQYSFRVKKSNYTTALPVHAIQGHKWQRRTRYFWCNFLNLYFAHSKTIEMRISEATLNFDKILHLMLTYVAILKYAENYNKVLSATKITLEQILIDYFPKNVAEQLLGYWEERSEIFTDRNGFKKNWKGIEELYREGDKKFNKKLVIE